MYYITYLMNLTKKIVLVIVLVCLLFSALYFLLFHIILTDRVAEQKVLMARKIVAGALSVFENENLRILNFSEDWASWDSMYNYVARPTRAFENDLGPELVLKDIGFSLLVIVNKKKEIILLKGYHHGNRKSIPFDLLRQKKSPLWDHLSRTFYEENSVGGIVQTEYGPMIAVSSPVLHTDDSGPLNGRLLFGRLVDQTFEKRISRTIREKAHLLFNPRTRKSPAASYKKMRTESDRIMEEVEEGKNSMIINYPVDDVNKRLAFVIRVDAQKHMFDILDNATRLFFMLLIAGFVLFGTIFYFIIHRLVVRRMQHISTTTNNIISFDDLSQRIPETYSDEITQLCRNINKMLERLETENIRQEEVERMLVLNEKLIFLGKVSATVAHEVNNPLFAIANTLRVLKKFLPPGDERLNKLVQVAEGEIKRVSNIARNMNKFSIKGMEKPVLSDVTSIIDAAINVIKWSKQLRNTRIDYRKPEGLFPFYCNPEALQQVFMNLILNAVDAMNGKGNVVIRVGIEREEYRIDFTDNGPGFDDSIKSEIFQPFKSTKAGKGSGLGLNISYNIIANHGGTITLDDNYSEGAHLIIKIPKNGGLNNASNGKSVTITTAG